MAEKCRRDHRRVGEPAFHEPSGRRHHFFVLGMVRRGRVGESLRRNRAHAAGQRGFGDLIFKEIPVAAGGCSGKDHLRNGQHGAVAHHLLVHEARFHGENMMMEPVHERQVVRQAPEADHRQMRMRVDQPRQDQAAAGVDDPVGRERAVCVHEGDAAAGYADGSIFNDVHPGGHGHQGAAGDGQIKMARWHGCLSL